MGVDYRAVARHLAAQRAVRPCTWRIRCSHRVEDLILADADFWGTDARGQLAADAVEAGWDVLPNGHVACPECVRRAEVGE